MQLPSAQSIFVPFRVAKVRLKLLYLLVQLIFNLYSDVELNNAVIIFDEAHNVEKMCEESASTQITTTDIAMAIEELTHLMKAMEKNAEVFEIDSDVSKDFTLDDLVILKGLMLEFEKVVNDVPIRNFNGGDTYDGHYLQKLLERAGVIMP